MKPKDDDEPFEPEPEEFPPEPTYPPWKDPKKFMDPEKGWPEKQWEKELPPEDDPDPPKGDFPLEPDIPKYDPDKPDYPHKPPLDPGPYEGDPKDWLEDKKHDKGEL